MDAEGDTKSRLVAEARDLYLEGGLASFSLREVARRASVSPGAVYRHFANKEALFAAVCARGFEAFGAYLVRSLSGATPRERMILAARMYLAFAVEHPRDYRVIFMGDAAAFGDGKVQGPTASPTFQFLVDRVAECVAAKVIARRDDVQTAMTIWALVHGLASLRITGHLASAGKDDHFADLFDRAVERLLAGMAPRAAK